MFTTMVKCLPEIEFLFTVFLKNRNLMISKIRRSKVTDYAALIYSVIQEHKSKILFII